MTNTIQSGVVSLVLQSFRATIAKWAWGCVALGISAVLFIGCFVLKRMGYGSVMRKHILRIVSGFPTFWLERGLRFAFVRSSLSSFGVDASELAELQGLLEDFRVRQLAYASYVTSLSSELSSSHRVLVESYLPGGGFVRGTPLLRVPEWDRDKEPESRALYAKLLCGRIGLPDVSRSVEHTWRPVERAIEEWADSEAARLVQRASSVVERELEEQAD